jgi:formylglycine-generating enzyme required for sulfatase activity
MCTLHQLRDVLALSAGLVLSAACSDILSLRQAQLSGACVSNAECAPGESCDEGLCLSGSCESGAKRCNGLTALQCSDDHTWLQKPCDAICSDGECDWPKSCANEELICPEDVSCCQAIELKADTFDLTYTYPDPTSDSMQLAADTVARRIRRFALDRFEVTVGRFRQFIYAYDTIPAPKQDDGAHPAFPGSGWQSAWDEDAGRYPGSQFAIERTVREHGVVTESDADPLPPIRGVNWYVALAFCIWDGARLPTEAEWAYAAIGGKEGRDFPWNSDLAPISREDAEYADGTGDPTGPAQVGTHSAGRGAFMHEDLAGNVGEWVADLHQTRMPSSCQQQAGPDECLELDGTEDRVTRGGSYKDPGALLRNTYRSKAKADRAQPFIGFRCARDLD